MNEQLLIRGAGTCCRRGPHKCHNRDMRPLVAVMTLASNLESIATMLLHAATASLADCGTSHTVKGSMSCQFCWHLARHALKSWRAIFVIWGRGARHPRDQSPVRSTIHLTYFLPRHGSPMHSQPFSLWAIVVMYYRVSNDIRHSRSLGSREMRFVILFVFPRYEGRRNCWTPLVHRSTFRSGRPFWTRPLGKASSKLGDASQTPDRCARHICE